MQDLVEIARRVTPAPGCDWVPLLTDDAKWARWIAQVEPDLDPDFEAAWIAWGVPTVRKGIDGYRAGWLDFVEPWTEFYGSISDGFIEAGEDSVLMLAHQRARHEGTGAEVELIGSAIFRFRDRRVRRLEFYAERDEGIKAARLARGVDLDHSDERGPRAPGPAPMVRRSGPAVA